VSLKARRERLEPRPLVDPTARRGLFTAALDALLAREGAGALEPFDALALVVAGGWAGERGSILWPHSSVLVHRGRPWRYYLMHAGSQGFEPIGVHCHELGHVLGLLDEYGVGGHDTGLGQWCAMADGADGGHADGVAKDAPPRTVEETARQAVREQLDELRQLLEGLGGGRAPGGGLHRPLHLCAVCKERLGWATPRVVDPRVRRRIALAPVEGDGRQVARVLLDPAGREALVLEYRGGTGFDAGLPRTGLLVWRTGDPLAMVRTFVPFLGHELVPAHGVVSTDAAERAPLEVMFPTPARRDVVVRGSRRGGFAVRLARIEEKDGRLLVEVGLAD
jgi:M6 family metalloprotease-like protein